MGGLHSLQLCAKVSMIHPGLVMPKDDGYRYVLPSCRGGRKAKVCKAVSYKCVWMLITEGYPGGTLGRRKFGKNQNLSREM